MANDVQYFVLIDIHVLKEKTRIGNVETRINKRNVGRDRKGREREREREREKAERARGERGSYRQTKKELCHHNCTHKLLTSSSSVLCTVAVSIVFPLFIFGRVGVAMCEISLAVCSSGCSDQSRLENPGGVAGPVRIGGGESPFREDALRFSSNSVSLSRASPVLSARLRLPGLGPSTTSKWFIGDCWSSSFADVISLQTRPFVSSDEGSGSKAGFVLYSRLDTSTCTSGLSNIIFIVGTK